MTGLLSRLIHLGAEDTNSTCDDPGVIFGKITELASCLMTSCSAKPLKGLLVVHLVKALLQCVDGPHGFRFHGMCWILIS